MPASFRTSMLCLLAAIAGSPSATIGLSTPVLADTGPAANAAAAPNTNAPPTLSSAAADDLLHLPIGDPARKDRQVPLVLDGITDTRTGQLISPAEMARRLGDTGILFIGENHVNSDFHQIQLQTIRALHDAGREVLIGLEMFPYTQQAVLDAWNAGRYTLDEFPTAADWYGNWGHHWNYYSDIFGYARQSGIALYAINSPRHVNRAVRESGFENLPAEVAAHFPPQIAPDTEAYRRLFRAAFSPDDALHMNEAMLSGLYQAQLAWDATMGWNALQARRLHGEPKSIMVVLIGAGHATYGLGAERQIAPYFAAKIDSLLPVPVADESDRRTANVQASYASYVWGVPPEREPAYPTLGVSLMGEFGKASTQVIQVSQNSVADRAGVRVGDVLTTFDGKPVKTSTGLKRLVAELRWGDEVRLGLRRDGEQLELPVAVRRLSP